MLGARERLPDRASYSQLSTFQRCRFRYWLRYMLGVERVTDSPGLIRGSLLHEAYDRYMWEGRTDHAIAHAVVDDLAQTKVNEGADAGVVNEVADEAHVVLEAYLPWADQHDKWELKRYEKDRCETTRVYDLPMPDGSVWPMTYKIDAHVEIDGGHFMLENKFRKNLDANGLEHDLQILLYQAFWNAQHPDDRIEGVLYNIVGVKPRKKDGVIAVRQHFYRGKQEERIGLRNAAAVLQTMKFTKDLGVWPYNPGKECNWDCDYVGLCLGVRSGGTVKEYLETGSYRLRPTEEEEGEDE